MCLSAAEIGLHGSRICLEHNGAEVVDDHGLEFMAKKSWELMILANDEWWFGKLLIENDQNEQNLANTSTNS